MFSSFLYINTFLPLKFEKFQDKDDLESILSEESIDFTPVPNPFFSRTMCCLYFLLWTTLYIIAIQIEFGAVYFVVSVLIFIYFNTRSGPKKKGEVSAYSVFNPDCHSIDGTLTAEQFEREIVYGAFNVHQQFFIFSTIQFSRFSSLNNYQYLFLILRLQ